MAVAFVVSLEESLYSPDGDGNDGANGMPV
jgi:hypothetical protein